MSRPSLRSRIAHACFLLAAVAVLALPACAALQATNKAPVGGIMVVAISRDDSVLNGGIGTGIRTIQGIANIEPIAWLTPSGLWHDLPCNYHWVNGLDIAHCRAFAASYLGLFHSYTIVSSDGYGATVQSSPVHLTPCNSFATRGLYSGGPVQRTAIAAGNPQAFVPSQPLQPVDALHYQQTLDAFVAAAPIHLRTLAGIRLYRTQWNGHTLILVERSFTDFSSANPSIIPNVRLLFAIGEIINGKFHVLFWKHNTADDNEQLLGTITLKSGKEFLVTSVNGPEAQFFRIYTLQDGRVQLVFSGGGSSC